MGIEVLSASHPIVQEKLVVRGLTKQFTVKNSQMVVFRDISFSVQEAEFVCILGPSGCGKSTLLLCVAGLESFSGGEIVVNGQSINGPGPDRGMVFQEYALFPWRTVARNVEFGLEMSCGEGRHQRRVTVRHLLGLVGLTDFADYYPYQLSGGMRQRVAIARSLATSPALLLMDEPFGALDAITRKSLQDETLRIWEKTRMTIIFVTHNILEAVYLADKVICFSRGPGRIKREVIVDLPRPRDVDTPNSETQQVIQILKELLLEES